MSAIKNFIAANGGKEQIKTSFTSAQFTATAEDVVAYPELTVGLKYNTTVFLEDYTSKAGNSFKKGAFFISLAKELVK